METRLFKIGVIVAILAAMAGLALGVLNLAPVETPVARGYATKCHFESGGNKITCANGGEIELQSGATLDVQSGASVGWSGTSGAGISTNYLTATTAISVAKATISGDLSARNITATGSISGASLTVNGASTFGGLATFSNDVSARNITSTSQIAAADGAVGTPSIAFASDMNSGLYSISADDWALAVGGTRRLELDGSGVNLNGGQFNVPDGTADAPIIRFTNDIDTGFYRLGSNSIGITGSVTINSDAAGGDLQLYGIDIAGAGLLWDASDNRLEGSGAATVQIGESTTGVTAAGGTTMIYGQAYQKTNALTGDLIGVRGNARVVDIDSGSGKAIGGYFTSGNLTDGYDMDIARGVYAGTTNKVPVAASSTWHSARGFEASMDLDQGAPGHTNTIDAAHILYGVYNLPTAGSYSTCTDCYGVFVRNEAVGGTGQTLSAAFAADNLNHSGGIAGWNYGLDFNGVDATGFGVADIRLSNGETVDNKVDGTIKLDAKLVGSAEGSVVYNTLHDVTISEINAGHTLVTVPAGRMIRLVDVDATAYGGACGAVTTVDLKVGSIVLVTYAQANLTQSTLLRLGSTGVTVLADGASFTVGAAGDDVTIIKNGSDVTTCTGVRFVLSYALD